MTEPIDDGKRAPRHRDPGSFRDVGSTVRPGPRPLPPAPLFAPALGMVAGILLDAGRPLPIAAYAVALAVALCAGGVVLGRRRAAGPLVFLAAVAVGGLAHHHTFWRIAPNHIVRVCRETTTVARVRGVVLTPPRVIDRRDEPFARWRYDTMGSAFLLSAEAVETEVGYQPACGRLRVVVAEPLLDVAPGSRVEVFGQIYRHRGPRNPGQFDWALFQWRRGVRATLSCKYAAAVRPVKATPELTGRDRHLTANNLWESGTDVGGPPRIGGWRSVWNALRERARRLLLEDIANPDGEATLLETLVLARRSAIDRRIEEAFVSAGCAHFLAASGAHLGIVAFLAWSASAALGLGRRSSAGTVIVATLLYTFLGDPRAPILRAAILAVTYFGGVLLDRPRNYLNWLSLAAIIILLADPPSLFSASFQLSFAAIIGVMYLTPVIVVTWRTIILGVLPRILSRHVMGRLRQVRAVVLGRSGYAALWMMAIALAAWIATLPILVQHFQRFSPWGWINSTVLFVPLTITMALGFAKLLAGMVAPALGSLLVVPLSWTNHSVVSIAGWMQQHLPGVSVSTEPWPWWLTTPWLMPAYYGVLLTVIAAHRRHPAVWGRALAVRAILLGGPHTWRYRAVRASLVRGPHRWRDRASHQVMRLSMLPAAHATCAVLHLPNRRNVLVHLSHPGYERRTDRSHNQETDELARVLLRATIRRIDALLLGAPSALRPETPSVWQRLFPVGPVYVPAPAARPASPPGRMLDMLRGAGHPVRTIPTDRETHLDDDITITWIAHGSTPTDKGRPRGVSHNLCVSDQATTVLACGDVSFDFMQQAIADGGRGADVLLAPLGKADMAVARRFLAMVRPQLVVDTDMAADGAPDAAATVEGVAFRYARLTPGNVLTAAVSEGKVHPLPSGDVARIGKRRGVRDGALRAAAIVASVGALALAIWLAWPGAVRGDRSVPALTALAVGRADAMVIETADGSAWLYDAGGGAGRDVGRSIILPFLRHRHIRRLTDVVVSHPNLDHFSGLPSVIDALPAARILLTSHFRPLSFGAEGEPAPTRTLRTTGAALLAMLATRDHHVLPIDRRNSPLSLGGLNVEILWPPGPDEPRPSSRQAGQRFDRPATTDDGTPLPSTLSSNDSSLVLRLHLPHPDHGRAGTILLAGDIEEGPQSYLARYADVRADVLVLPHHGSVRSTTGAFIEAVAPQVVIRSGGRHADRENKIERLVGQRLFYDTAVHGAVRVELTADGWQVTTVVR